MLKDKIKNYNIPRFSKPIGTAISVVLVALGILLFIFPKILVILMYIISASLVVYGIYSIVKYIGMQKGTRQGWTLATGIILTVCGVYFFINDPTSEALTYSFLLAMLGILFGIDQLISTSSIKANGGKTGFLIFGGILCILAGLFFCIAPIFMEVAFDYVLAVFLIISGVYLFIDIYSISFKKKNKIEDLDNDSTIADQVTKEVVHDAIDNIQKVSTDKSSDNLDK